MPTAETSTKVNNPTSNGASAQSRRSVFLSKVCQMDKVSSIKSCGGCLLGVGETKRMCRETGRFAAHPLILFVVIGFPCTLSNHLPK